MNERTLNNVFKSSPVRNAYGTQKKMQIIEAYYNVYRKNATETARQFNLSQSMVSRLFCKWMKHQHT